MFKLKCERWKYNPDESWRVFHPWLCGSARWVWNLDSLLVIPIFSLSLFFFFSFRTSHTTCLPEGLSLLVATLHTPFCSCSCPLFCKLPWPEKSAVTTILVEISIKSASHFGWMATHMITAATIISNYRTTLHLYSGKYYVLAINYTIQLVNVGVQSNNCSALPLHSLTPANFTIDDSDEPKDHVLALFVSCGNPL